MEILISNTSKFDWLINQIKQIMIEFIGFISTRKIEICFKTKCLLVPAHRNVW